MIPSLPNNLKCGPTASDMITETSNTQKAQKPALYSQRHKKPISHAISSFICMLSFPLLLGSTLVRKEISKYLKP